MVVKRFKKWVRNWLTDDFVLKCKKLHPDAKLPTRSYDSVGYDLYSVEDVKLTCGYINKHVYTVSTGIAIEIPYLHAFLIWDRSGLASKGLHRLAGVVDFGYRGEVKVCLVNLGNLDYQIKKGDRIAQVLIQKVELPEVVWVDELSDTKRGCGGFGSSGK